MTRDEIARDLFFGDLPPDDGIVTPVARPDEAPDPNQVGVLEHIRRTLPEWKSATADPLERAASYLQVAAVADLQQLVIERHVPLVILEQLLAERPREDVIRLLYWIAMHPDAGGSVSNDDLRALRLDADGVGSAELEHRVAIYAMKLLQRLLSADRSGA